MLPYFVIDSPLSKCPKQKQLPPGNWRKQRKDSKENTKVSFLSIDGWVMFSSESLRFLPQSTISSISRGWLMFRAPDDEKRERKNQQRWLFALPLVCPIVPSISYIYPSPIQTQLSSYVGTVWGRHLLFYSPLNPSTHLPTHLWHI